MIRAGTIWLTIAFSFLILPGALVLASAISDLLAICILGLFVSIVGSGALMLWISASAVKHFRQAEGLTDTPSKGADKTMIRPRHTVSNTTLLLSSLR